MSAVRSDGQKAPFGDRLRDAFLKPPKPGTPAASSAPKSVQELEAEVRSASDKERVIGLLAAPWAAGIGVLVVGTLISHDPAAYLADGLPNKLHVSVSLYHEVMIVLIVLALAMLGLAWFRKRLYLGMVMALYGLTVFNLHYWGFGVPFVMCGAWLLVRSYRLQRAFKEASSGPGGGTTFAGRPRASRRYTPPASRSRS